MTGDDWAAQVPVVVELQVDKVHEVSPAEMTMVVRNLRGPVSRGAHFHAVSDSREPLDLVLVRIMWYQREVTEIPRGHTALVTVRGAGLRAIRSGTLTTGWQSIRGQNPPA